MFATPPCSSPCSRPFAGGRRPCAGGRGRGSRSRPAFSLSTSEVFTTRDAPHFYPDLPPHPAARLPRLQGPRSVRVLRGPERSASVRHRRSRRSSRSARGSSGSPTGSAASGSALRSFARAQASHDYRATRRAASDKAEVAQRVALNANTFAQVPLLNADQVVTTWRELLPNNRDAEVRRVPLDLKQPGIYVVEAVNDLLRAYTIVIVSDVGLVTKTSPGQMLFFAANRFTGEPIAGLRRPRARREEDRRAKGRTNADGLFEGELPPDERWRRRRRRAVRRSDRRHRSRIVGAAAAGARAGRLHLHRQADLSARAHGARQGDPALAPARCAGAVRSARGGAGRHRRPTTRWCSASR